MFLRTVLTDTNLVSRYSRLSLTRTLASKSSSSSPPSDSSFRPARRAPKAIQQAILPKPKTRSKKQRDPVPLSSDTSHLGIHADSAIDYLSKQGDRAPDHESILRLADYMTADVGTTEDLVGQRRAMMELDSPQDAEDFEKTIMDWVEQESDKGWKNLSWVEDEKKGKDEKNVGSALTDEGVDLMQKAYGPWSETIVKVDRVQKVQRGGTMVRYRALVIGGNLNGCAGFGVAKANAPNEATAAAARVAKRNIFFIDRYLGSGLTSDLAGRHNSCRVALRSVNPNRGLNGHPLICEILKYFGITDCSAKSHGNRNPFNVVRATFKAIMTHESLEDIALKRGKRLLTLERAKRLKI